MIDWQPVQGVPCLLPNVCCDMLHLSATLHCGLENEWMLNDELQEIIYISVDLENKSIYTVCLSHKPENGIQPELSGRACGFLYPANYTTLR